jgi:hypothetical protein
VLIYLVFWLAWIAYDVRSIKIREEHYHDLFVLVNIIPEDLRFKDTNIVKLNTIR